MSAIHRAVLVLGFFNLMVAVVQIFRPDLWAGFWRGWVKNPLFRLHGLFLISIGVLLVAALPVPRLTWALWIAIAACAAIGGTILFTPDAVRGPLGTFFNEQTAEEIARLTLVDAAFRIATGLVFILAVLG